MIKMNMKALIEQLDSYYQSAIKHSDNEKLFFLCIADYLKFISENKKTISSIESVIKSSKEHYKKLIELAQISTDETKVVIDKLKKVIKKNKIQSSKIDQIFLEMHQYEIGKRRSNQPEVERVFNFARDVIHELKPSCANEVKDFYVTYPDSSEIKEFTFSEHYMTYHNEKEVASYLEKVSLWSAWNKLVRVYQTTYGIRELLEVSELNFQKNEWDLGSLYYDWYKAMKGIIEGHREGNNTLEKFMVEEYREYLVRINNYLLGELRVERKSKLANPVDSEVLNPVEPQPIRKIEIRKGNTEYQILINGVIKYNPMIKSRSGSDSSVGYWDMILKIANKETADGDTNQLKNAANYLNGNRDDNPLFRDCPILKEPWVRRRGYSLVACDDVIIEPLSDKTYRAKFRKAP